MPFWLASLLRKRNLCRVKPPEWMNSESLTNVLAEEKRFVNEWQKLPHHYIEIAKLMFTVAEEDFSEFDMDVHEVSSDSRSSEARQGEAVCPPAPTFPLTRASTPLSASLVFSLAASTFAPPFWEQIRRLIDDIRLVRFNKIEKQFKEVTSAMTIRLTNFCAMELNLMRGFLLSSLDEYHKFSKAEEDVQHQSQMTQDPQQSVEPQVRQLR